MNRNFKWIVIGISLCFFLLFTIFTLYLRGGNANQFDFDTTVRLQNKIPLKYDHYLSLLSFFASFPVMTVLLIGTLLIRKKILGIGVFVMFAGAHAIEIVGKLFLHHPGPPFMFFRKESVVSFEQNYVVPGSSYPSGHSLRVSFLSVIWIYLIVRSKLVLPVKILLIGIICTLVFFVLFSRVSLGEHWSTDVIGGLLFGIATSFFALLLL